MKIITSKDDMMPRPIEVGDVLYFKDDDWYGKIVTLYRPVGIEYYILNIKNDSLWNYNGEKELDTLLESIKEYKGDYKVIDKDKAYMFIDVE